MTETIEVVYKPIASIGIKTIYHKYIIYTDSNGAYQYARGGPAVGDGYESRGGDPSSQSVAEPSRNIVTEYGEFLWMAQDMALFESLSSDVEGYE